MAIEIHPIVLFKHFIYIIIILLCANIMGIVSKLYFDHDYVYGLVPLFNFNVENNIPTFFSACVLICASLLLFFIASIHKKLNSSYIAWLGLAIIFLFLSVDEITAIHERFTVPVRASLNTSGLLFYAWVIPYGAAVLVFMIAYFKFLMNFPRNIMMLFVFSGAVYVSGALGLELFGGWQAEAYGVNNLMYSIFYTCEELLEMLGVVIFIYALLTYIVSQFKFQAIIFSEKT